MCCCWVRSALLNSTWRPKKSVLKKAIRIRLDLEPQVLRLSVPEDKDFDDEGGRTDAPISPTLAALKGLRIIGDELEAIYR